MKLKKGDNVKILSGKDRGRTGVVLKAYPDDDRIQIDGLNVFKKRSKPRKQGEKGQVVAVSRPLAASKVMIICPNCKSPTRMGGRMEVGRAGPDIGGAHLSPAAPPLAASVSHTHRRIADDRIQEGEHELG